MTDQEKILSNDYLELILDYPFTDIEDLLSLGFVYQPVESDIGILYLNRRNVDPLNIRNYAYRIIPKLYGLMQLNDGSRNSFNPSPLFQSGITQVQREPLNLTGSGVVMGFIDTGIRYEDEVFRTPEGNTRILGIWDQTIQTGNPPEGLLYGSEYTREMINEALKSENPRELVPSYDENGHGTAIASVAAGSSVGNGLRFLGAAPEADIVMVKCRQTKQYLRDFYLVPDDVEAYAESDLLTALKYLESYAVALKRPLVICMGMGSNMGNHQGTSILSEYLNRIAIRRSRGVVVCGGNEGNSAGHYVGYAVEGIRETIDNVEIRVDIGEKGFMAELWGSIPANHAISIKTPGGETTTRVDFRGMESRQFSFVYEKTKVIVDHVLVEQGSGEELIVFRFIDPTPGVWTIQVTIIEGNENSIGSFHIWLPIRQFLSGDTYFLRPSPYTTLTEPSNARDVITVTAYNDLNGSFYAESGRGFTRDERIKPDICAPGVSISTAVGAQSGTSMAAALTAGAAAQFMQWAVVEENRLLLEGRELKNYLIRGADRDGNIVYPNREWGYGRLNIARTFDVLAGV